MAISDKYIKVRLVMLDKTQEDLRKALAERGYEVLPQSLSRWVIGQRTPQDTTIMTEIHLVLAKWEREQNKNKGAEK